MLSNRSWKYRTFLWQLRIFKYISFTWKKGTFLEQFYTLMRYVDDVVDGDIKLPAKFSSEYDFISQLISFAKHGGSVYDEASALFSECAKLAHSMDLEYQEETIDILTSIQFDAERRGKMLLLDEKELIDHYYRLDICGTIKGTAKLLKENPDRFELIIPLGTAVRYQYDIEDVEADLKAGYINMSRQECELLGITMEHLISRNPKAISTWQRYKATKGIQLLEEHREMMKKEKFRFVTKLGFMFVYERPARKVFRKYLGNRKYAKQ